MYKSYNILINIIDYTRSYCFLLEELKNWNIPINYQCKSGYCGSCRILLIKGKIKYYKKPLISYLKPGEILTCCCQPITHIILKM